MRFSDKQYRAATFGERDARHVVLVGAYRSGKSASGLRGFLHWAGDKFADHDFCLAAKSAKQWTTVCHQPMLEWCANAGVSIRARPDHFEIESRYGTPNRLWRVIGGGGDVQASAVSGELAAARVEGMTFAGAYVDDACFVPFVLIQTLADRCSVAGAKLVYTLYPQGPFHPFKLDYIDKIESGELNGEITTFAISDNPSNSAQWISERKAALAGQPHEYMRKIEGKWTSASGLIYSGFEPHVANVVSNDLEPTIFQWDVAADWASSSVTHALLVGAAPDGTYWVWDEWRHDGREEGILSSDTQADRMIEHLTASGQRSIRNWIIDPTADGLKLALRDRVQGNVVDGENDVDEGLRTTARWIHAGRLHFRRKGVPGLLREMGSYSWDAKQARLGIDKPDKESGDGAHGADALRYYCNTFEVARQSADAGYGVA